MKHINQVKKALQIGGVHTAVSSWYQPGNKKDNGAQIDLLNARRQSKEVPMARFKCLRRGVSAGFISEGAELQQSAGRIH